MRKILLASLVLPCLAFASSVDMSTLKCRDTKLNASSTLGQIQGACLIKKQKAASNGMYEVVFRNDTTQKNVTCYFASKKPEATLNGCK